MLDKTVADHDRLTLDRKRGQHDEVLIRLGVLLNRFEGETWEGGLIEIEGFSGTLFNRDEGTHVRKRRVVIVEPCPQLGSTKAWDLNRPI